MDRLESDEFRREKSLLWLKSWEDEEEEGEGEELKLGMELELEMEVGGNEMRGELLKLKLNSSGCVDSLVTESICFPIEDSMLSWLERRERKGRN